MVDKPPGVVVHPARGHRQGTLVAGAGRPRGRRRRIPSARASCTGSTATPPGLLVVARSEAVHAALKAQLARRELVREYLALVEGRPPARRGTIDAPLGRDRRVRTRISTDTDEGREAITHFEVERGAAARHAAARAAGDRPHAPDPRAPAGDRAPGRGRPRVRDAPVVTGSSASSCTRPGSRSGIPVDGRGGRRRLAAAGRPRRRARKRRGIEAGRSTGGRGREGRPAPAPTHAPRSTCGNSFVYTGPVPPRPRRDSSCPIDPGRPTQP